LTARINIIVEGQTEESFIKNVLAPYLWPQGIYMTASILGIPGHKGGNVNYARVRKDILLQLKQDRMAYCSTMLDLYGLGVGFPETTPAASLTGTERAARLEQAIVQDVTVAAPDLRADLRFIPHFQVHEYEALLFSDPDAFASALGKADLTQQFRSVRAAFSTPEDINDDPQTAPSKRVLGLYPSYKKVIDGTIAATAVGLEKMLLECPHFRSWVERLSTIGTAQRP
jgi:hypothetical protein